MRAEVENGCGYGMIKGQRPAAENKGARVDQDPSFVHCVVFFFNVP